MALVLNDLFDYDYKIYQDTNAFKFSIDSILIAEFAKINKKDKVLDLCTGNGVIPLILSKKYMNHIYGMEIQKDIYDLAKMSIKHNRKESQITLINDDVNNVLNYFPGNSLDIILCNPPYFKNSEESHKNPFLPLQIARHEVKINLGNILELSSKLLNNKKKLYLVHLTERIDEIILLSNKYGMAVKYIQPIYPNFNKKSNIALYEIVKKGKSGVKMLPPLDLSKCKTYQNIFDGVK